MALGADRATSRNWHRRGDAFIEVTAPTAAPAAAPRAGDICVPAPGSPPRRFAKHHPHHERAPPDPPLRASACTGGSWRTSRSTTARPADAEGLRSGARDLYNFQAIVDRQRGQRQHAAGIESDPLGGDAARRAAGEGRAGGIGVGSTVEPTSRAAQRRGDPSRRSSTRCSRRTRATPSSELRPGRTSQAGTRWTAKSGRQTIL